MSRQLFCAGVLGVLTLAMLTSGCSNGPGTGDESAASGTIDLPLTAQSDGVNYRLNKAEFTIISVDGSFKRVIHPDADLPVDTESLVARDYTIELSDGWVLEAQGPSDSGFSAVDAVLTTPNPFKFTVKAGKAIDVVFAFISRGIKIQLDKGRANVRISVSDCKQFDSFTSAIADYTVQCLGTIDPESFFVDGEGYLRRNFKACVNRDQQSLIQSIDNFLGLQYVEKRDTTGLAYDPLTYGRDCLAGRWAAWHESFDNSGSTECPTWKRDFVENEPTPELYDKFAAALPKLPFEETGARPSVLRDMKINTRYITSFPNGQPDQQCGSAGNCAQLCAGGFSGFVIGGDGDTIMTDPPPWERDTIYDPKNNPFLRTNYYHPMSLYGALPGDLFGADARVGEQCSYYSSTGRHEQTPLLENCVVTPDSDHACVSLCAPPTIF